MATCGSRLGAQLFIQNDSNGFRTAIGAVRNDPKRLQKPSNGFWTSTYDADYGSDWFRWCVAHRYNSDISELRWIVLTPAKPGRIAVIDSPEDLARWTDGYPRRRGRAVGVDFEAMAQDFDALHVTRAGYLRAGTRPSKPSLRN